MEEEFSDDQLIKRVFKEITLICLGFSAYQTIFLALTLIFPIELGVGDLYLGMIHLGVFISIDFGIFGFYYFRRRAYLLSRWGKEWESRDDLKKFGRDLASILMNPLNYALVEVLIIILPDLLYDSYDVERMLFLWVVWSMNFLSYFLMIIYGIIFRRRKYLD